MKEVYMVISQTFCNSNGIDIAFAMVPAMDIKVCKTKKSAISKLKEVRNFLMDAHEGALYVDPKDPDPNKITIIHKDLSVRTIVRIHKTIVTD